MCAARRTISAVWPTDHVHDVVNPGPGVATSVHVYSPPMEKMTFFAPGPSGLVAARTQHRSDPDWAP